MKLSPMTTYRIATARTPRAAGIALVIALGAAGCGMSSAPNPYGYDAGSDAADASDGETGGGGSGPVDAGPDADPTLGGPCLDDGQCDDGFDCTFDTCDAELKRCRFTPDDVKCQNGVYCDGVERCDNKLGCTAGAPVSCDDKTPCTIDTCDEATQGCKHVPRDADGDGDVDIHCPGGHDCDDADPTISSLVPEVCGNAKDDNCDGQIDEATCSTPQHDTCLDPLEITASGTYPMDSTGAKFDYPTSCGIGNQPSARDVVAAIVLPAGPPVDVEVKAATLGYPVSIAMAGQCGDPSTELGCGGSYSSPAGGTFAKTRARGIGSATASTAFPVYVSTSPGAAIALDVQIVPATPKPTNETCGTALPITPGAPVTVPILDAVADLGSACGTALGELVYTFESRRPGRRERVRKLRRRRRPPGARPARRGLRAPERRDHLPDRRGAAPLPQGAAGGHVLRLGLRHGADGGAVDGGDLRADHAGPRRDVQRRARAGPEQDHPRHAHGAPGRRRPRLPHGRGGRGLHARISRPPPTCSSWSASPRATSDRWASRSPRARRRRRSGATTAAPRRCDRRSATSPRARTASSPRACSARTSS
ncbi:MAG: putative metal-binding motif-containing protein [Minicystis sp.]